MHIDPIEIRNWISFVFLIIGGSIAIRSFVINQHQRKLENSFKLIHLCNDSLSNDDIKSWISINYASSEQAGAQKGFFVDNKEQIPFSELFVPGKIIGQASIEKFCELFNLIGYEYIKGTVDIRLFYFEYGQYLRTVHYWVSSVDGSSMFFKSRYPYFYKMCKHNQSRFSKMPYKTISQFKKVT